MSYTTEGRRYASGSRTGVRAAADFTIDVGFTPRIIRVSNLTTGAEAVHNVDASLDAGNNVKSRLVIATGVRTYVAAGISSANRSFTVDVSIASLETNDCDLFWEAFD